MKKLNLIGLNEDKTLQLAEKLNLLLAQYSIFYQNTRGFHWNIKGLHFFELHSKFEELYNDLFLKIDEIAERILTLGYLPNYKYSDYLKQSQIEESPFLSDGLKATETILSSLRLVIILQREVLAIASEIDDQGTFLLMSNYIREQEKLAWMYSSFLDR